MIEMNIKNRNRSLQNGRTNQIPHACKYHKKHLFEKEKTFSSTCKATHCFFSPNVALKNKKNVGSMFRYFPLKRRLVKWEVFKKRGAYFCTNIGGLHKIGG